MFQNINVTNKALDATMLRFNTLAENISNVDTPGYKRKDVQFEHMLNQEIEKYGIEGVRAETLEPKVYTDMEMLSYRMDGNNVDIDKEMTELTQVKLRYDTLIQRATAQLNRYKTILQNLR